MEKQIYVFFADGFEDIEALGTVDILRRAGLQVTTVSVMDEKIVRSAHGVPVICDEVFEKGEFGSAGMLVLPGGMPGAANLAAHKGLAALIRRQVDEGKPYAAICAAPMVYGKLGLLEGKKATCYPGFEQFLEGADYTGALVETDGNLITGKGPGATFLFALAIVRHFCGEAKVNELRQGMFIL